ncbi:MAG TPA: hypothetical protein VKU19_30100 [Bryobacteraceae bacterium]|nr:hypothetical protein [Bryobacteraceae bacterium]
MKRFSFFSPSAEPALSGQAAIDAGLEAIGKGDYAAAFQSLLPEAERGHKICQGLIGKMCEEGNGTARNYVGAARWHQRAAAQGYAAAQVALGVLYQKAKA